LRGRGFPAQESPQSGQALLASGSGLPWVWVCRDGFGGPAIQSEIQRLRGLQVLRPGYLPAEDLPALYSGATFLTFVSHDEGFGLPALEAMACGTPAVVADRGALPEVTGDAALHADPSDPHSIAEAIARLADDGDLRERLRERGIERARRFSWKKTAEETRSVYREALAGA
ncbi:MAG: glycosyltransferase family 1 protein, partial [Myxococcota bacterium]